MVAQPSQLGSHHGNDDVGADFTANHNIARPPVQFVPSRKESSQSVVQKRAADHSIDFTSQSGSFDGAEAPNVITSSPRLVPADDERRVAEKKKDAKGPIEKAKRRRTRSGCYTCRTRRVKCDEARPVCNRCFKGNRDCIYPPVHPPGKVRAKSKTGLDRSRPRSARRADSSSREPSEPLPPSPLRDPGVLGLAPQDPATTIDDATTTFFGPPADPLISQLEESDFAFIYGQEGGDIPGHGDRLEPLAEYPQATMLPDDIRFFLAYYLKNLSHRSFFQRGCTQAFFHGLLVSHALDYEPLLYAVVAFAAYFYCCSQPNEPPSVFLAYYQKSLSQLRISLTSADTPRPHDAMLLTILMFSSLEEYLGDIVNLVAHQRAAHRMLMLLHTPEKVASDYFSQVLFCLFTRFDVIICLTSNSETFLDESWYLPIEQVARYDVLQDALDLQPKLFLSSVLIRKAGVHMAQIFARQTTNYYHNFPGQYEVDARVAEATLSEIHEVIESMKICEHHASVGFGNDKEGRLVEDFGNFDPIYQPDVPVYAGELGEMSGQWLDYTATMLLFRWRVNITGGPTDYAGLAEMALQIARVIALMDESPQFPDDIIVTYQNALGLSVIFLPEVDDRGVRWREWSMQKLAKVEQFGFNYPQAMHERISQLWNEPALKTWWLPNDQNPNKFMRIRREWAKREPGDSDSLSLDANDLKAIFAHLKFNDETGSSS